MGSYSNNQLRRVLQVPDENGNVLWEKGEPDKKK